MYKQYVRKVKSHDEQKSILFWLIMAFVVLFLFIAPFYKGLFNGGQPTFEGPLYSAVVWSSIALFLLSIYLFYNRQMIGHRDLLGILVWLIPLSYLISSINAASYHSAMNSVYFNVLYAVFFMIGLVFVRKKTGLVILQNSIVLSGYLLVIYGLMNWFGNANYQDAVLQGRLSNVFQYPNTYAAYLVGIFLSALHLVHISKRWFAILGHAVMLVPIFVSLLLTVSRGGLLIFPIVLLIYLLFLSWTRQLIALFIVGISGAASMVIFNSLVDIRNQLVKEFVSSISLTGWGTLIITSAIVTIVVFLFQRYVAVPLYSKFQQSKIFRLANFIIPFALIIIAAMGLYLLLGTSVITDKLPSGVKQRIENFNSENSSVLSRGTFYKDAIQIVKDNPIFGAGGGAWSNLYDSYKSYPYTSRQAHNFFLQYLVETGFIGFIILLGFIGYIYYIFIRHYNRQGNESAGNVHPIFLLMSVSLLGHSIIDFDMSFIYVAALVFLCLGGMAYLPESVKTSPTTEPSPKNQWYKWFPLVAGFLSIFIFILSILSLSASSSYAAALKTAAETKDYNQITQNIDKALDLQPNHPDYQLFKINLLRQVYQQTKDEKFYLEAQERIQQLKRTEPYNRRIVEEQYALYLVKEDYKEALALISTELNKFSWDISLYERIIGLNFELGNKARLEGTMQKMDEYWGKALQVYRAVDGKRKYLDQLPPTLRNESKDFKVTPNMALAAGQIYYKRGDYATAYSVFGVGRISNDFSDPLNRLVARWTLASLQKQSKNDPRLLQLLLKADPNEQEYINEILKSR